MTGNRFGVLWVAGAHRSGTSALTRVVNLLGAAIPSDLSEANAFNVKGYWEPLPLVRLNNDLLARMGATWNDWRPVSDPLEADRDGRLMVQAREFLRDALADHSLLVLKDPRICSLIPFWEDACDRETVAASYLIPLRSPFEVARSLARRENTSVQWGLALWLRNTLDAETSTRSKPRSFTIFDELQNDWRAVADRIASQLRLQWPMRHDPAVQRHIQGFLDKSLVTSTRTRDENQYPTRLAALAAAAFDAQLALISNPQSLPHLAELDRIRGEFDGAERRAGPFEREECLPTAFARKIDEMSAVGLQGGAERLAYELQLLGVEAHARRLTACAESMGARPYKFARRRLVATLYRWLARLAMLPSGVRDALRATAARYGAGNSITVRSSEPPQGV